MIKRIDIKSYTPTLHDIFFFDSNIWMYLFAPLGGYDQRKQNIYSDFYYSALRNKSTIYINSLILSEFANATLKLDFKHWVREQNTVSELFFKKNYIPTERYKETAKSVNSAIRNILATSERMSDNFNAINLDRVLSHLEIVDFNDSYFEDYCKISNLKLVTDDKDYFKLANSNISVISIL